MSSSLSSPDVSDLRGLNGTSLTAYLAGLGALRLLAEAGQSVRLGWGAEEPHRARLEHPDLDGAELAERIAAALDSQLGVFDPFPGKAVKLKEVSPSAYRAAAAAAMNQPGRLGIDLLTAFGSDAAVISVKSASKGDGRTKRWQASAPEKTAQNAEESDGASGGEGGLIDPPWSVLNGAMQRNLLGIVRGLQGLARPPLKSTPERRRRSPTGTVKQVPSLTDRVRSVIDGPWLEKDKAACLYLDPGRRDHAYRWKDPTTDPAEFDGIANLLALVGLSLLPSIPVQSTDKVVLGSTCYKPGKNGTNTVSWPIWRGMVALGGVRRLLLVPGLTDDSVPSKVAARGIVTVMRAENFLFGEKGARAYSAPTPVWSA